MGNLPAVAARARRLTGHPLYKSERQALILIAKSFPALQGEDFNLAESQDIYLWIMDALAIHQRSFDRTLDWIGIYVTEINALPVKRGEKIELIAADQNDSAQNALYSIRRESRGDRSTGKNGARCSRARNASRSDAGGGSKSVGLRQTPFQVGTPETCFELFFAELCSVLETARLIIFQRYGQSTRGCFHAVSLVLNHTPAKISG